MRVGKRGLTADYPSRGVNAAQRPTPNTGNAIRGAGVKCDPADALRRSLVRPEREQHGTVLIEPTADVLGAMTARAQPSIERMLRRGQLSFRQAAAGQRIYSAWALGICGARNSEASGNGSDPGGYTDRQLDAATEYRRIRDAVGLRLWPIVWHTCCDDWTVDRFATERGNGMDRKQLMGCLKMALDMAADCLGLADD